MGGGSWTKKAFTDYVTCNYSADIASSVCNSTSGEITLSVRNQEIYHATGLNAVLSPMNVMRECKDTDEHPNTVPIILALDVTGSMGDAAVEVAKKINVIITNLYSSIKDVEFLVMGIGDLAYDDAPIQISQFESDIRILEQLDKTYFEFGGGGNKYESYTAAWYMGSRHTSLDCWNRNKKGIIITIGDEELNPYLPKYELAQATGDKIQADIETNQLYNEVTEKFDVFHIDVDHSAFHKYKVDIVSTWKKYLDDNHFKTVNMNSIADTIVEMINFSIGNIENSNVITNENGEIVW